MTSLYGFFYLIQGSLAYQEYLFDFSQFPPPALPLIFIPLIATMIICFKNSFLQMLQNVKLSSLVLFQSFRFLAEIYIYLMILEGLMPEIMTFTGRNFDILVPLLAVPLFFILRSAKFSQRIKTKLVYIFNYGGILILTNTIVTAILTMPTPAQVFKVEPPLVVPALFSAYLLPAFMVSLAYALHVLCLRKLNQSKL